MKIALIGSWKPEEAQNWSLTNEDEFREACRSVAGEIAKGNHQLIVGGQSEQTADYYAVEGVIRTLGYSQVTSPPIVILRPNDQKRPYEDWRTKYPQLFTSAYSPEQTWHITKLFQVKQADAVIVIGGADKSFQAGVAAAVSGRRIVPIGSFGGAGKRLISLFQSSRGSWQDNVPTDEQLGSLHNPWTSTLLKDGLRLLGLIDFPRLLIIHGRSGDRYKLKNYLQNTIGLPEPTIMAERQMTGAALPEKFENLARGVDGAIALVTPDDVGGLANASTNNTEFEKRARENVWLEVGWFWGRLGRKRFLLLRQNQTSIPSDLTGIEYFSYQSDPAECSEAIRNFINELSSALALSSPGKHLLKKQELLSGHFYHVVFSSRH